MIVDYKKVDSNVIKDNNFSMKYVGELLYKNFGLNDFEIKKNEFGKPYIENCDIKFNVSHSHDYIMCAIDNKNIGCDIEKVREIDINIAKSFFTKNEYSFIMHSNNDNTMLTNFFKIWCLKESFIKCVGRGLYIPLDSFEIIIKNKNNFKIIQHYNNNEYNFYEYSSIDGYVMVVCSEL